MRRRLLQLSLIFLLLQPVIACAGPEVQIAQRGNIFVVSSEVALATSAELAWQVLSDYNRLAEFVPDLRVSRVISAPGEPLQVEQSGEAGFLIFRFSIDVVLDIEDEAPVRLGFRAIRGNMRTMRGEWRIEKSAPGIRLIYAAELEPSFWVPPVIGPAVLRRDISAQIEGVVREIERRQAIAASASSPLTTQSAK